MQNSMLKIAHGLVVVYILCLWAGCNDERQVIRSLRNPQYGFALVDGQEDKKETPLYFDIVEFAGFERNSDYQILSTVSAVASPQLVDSAKVFYVGKSELKYFLVLVDLDSPTIQDTILRFGSTSNERFTVEHMFALRIRDSVFAYAEFALPSEVVVLRIRAGSLADTLAIIGGRGNMGAGQPRFSPDESEIYFATRYHDSSVDTSYAGTGCYDTESDSIFRLVSVSRNTYFATRQTKRAPVYYLAAGPDSLGVNIWRMEDDSTESQITHFSVPASASYFWFLSDSLRFAVRNGRYIQGFETIPLPEE